MLGLMLTTWFLSLWVCNAATTAMMLPIATAILDQLKTNRNNARIENNGTFTVKGTCAWLPFIIVIVVIAIILTINIPFLNLTILFIVVVVINTYTTSILSATNTYIARCR